MCRKSFEAELYAHFGTNEYNFVKLENPDAFHLSGLPNRPQGRTIRMAAIRTDRRSSQPDAQTVTRSSGWGRMAI
jgi:hypothetical protein